MRIAFRTDANNQIGTGHFMRCLTLADGLKHRGAMVRFVSRHLPEHLRALLEEKGYEFRLLENKNNNIKYDEVTHSAWLGVSQEEDATASIQSLEDCSWDWLVIDHYALDYRWETLLRKISNKILVIDDIADRQHDCDVLLDQNYYSNMDKRYIDKVPASCDLLLGPRYALLRDEFRQQHEQNRVCSGSVERILIFFGGVDADNITGRVINVLSELDLPGVHIDVVIGMRHPNIDEVKSACDKHEFTCHIQTNDMARLMKSADLAIGAGGSAMWERCCVGLPTLSISTAYNQNKQVADAAQEGLLYAPDIVRDFAGALKTHVTALIENMSLRKFISRNGINTVDGRGVQRVIESMRCAGVIMRLAIEEDSKNIFEWRNHPDVRKMSANKNIIDWDEHDKWFMSKLRSPDSFVLIGMKGENTIGVVRFDIIKDVAEVSIYIVPDSNYSGLGRSLLLSSEQWILDNLPDVKRITACVLGGNVKSHRLFLGANYKEEVTHYFKEMRA